MRIIKNYIVVERVVGGLDDKGYEGHSYRVRAIGDCFNTYAEAREYAMSICEKHKESSFGEIFYIDPEEPKRGEMPSDKHFLVIREIDTVICKIGTTDNYFLAHINNFYDNNMGETVNQRTLMSFLRDNNYINVRDVEGGQDVIINTTQITFVRL